MIRRLSKALAISSVILLIVFFSFLAVLKGSNYILQKKSKPYSNHIGTTLYGEKLLGFNLFSYGLQRDDNYVILGSSELGSASRDNFHPSNVFKGKKNGFQINLFGRGNCQSLFHLTNILAHEEDFKNRKFTFIVSPQWFSNAGISKDRFYENFSKRQFISVLLNRRISKESKITLCVNTLKYLEREKDELIFDICKTYSNNGVLKSLGRLVYRPFLVLYDSFLELKDSYDAMSILKKYDEIPFIKYGGKIQWDRLASLAVEEGAKKSEERFFIDKEYYHKFLEKKIDDFKGYQKSLTLTDSQEYSDFELLLGYMEKMNCDPLFINVPVNGFWYDYCGVSREERHACYSKISQLIRKYNFKEVDLTSLEYEKFTLRDTMHLGWNGWVKIDEAIYNHYSEHEK